jgi:hypothetical protein
MLRAIAKIYAKLSYLFALEVESAKNEINAATAKRKADEKRKLVEQLNAEADAIEKNIKEVAEKEEKGYWLCECGKENSDVPPLPQTTGHKVHCDCGKEMKLVKRSDMSGQEKYESDKELKDAEKIIAEKRALATQEATNVSEGEKVAQMLRGRAADSRAFADKIRQI